MSNNFNSAELVSHQAINESQISAITDTHYGQLRRETQTAVSGEAQVAFERHQRDTAYMEIGRGRNMIQVV